MNLSNRNIAQAVDDIQNFFQQAKISERDKLRINLVVEEVFLRWQEHFGAEKNFQMQMRNWFGTPSLRIKIRGDEFNPLETSTDELATISEEVMQNLLTYEGARTTFRYRNGCNELNIFAGKERKPIKILGGSITTCRTKLHFPPRVLDVTKKFFLR
ncbi:MAG: hypothetical protein IJP68_04015 [Selenomonadaceae bacterium]|nr:hypothetical protein [Selenomonadaceae bacterium]